MLKKLTLFASLLLLWNIGFAQDIVLEEGFEGESLPVEWVIVDEDADAITWKHVTTEGNASTKSVGIDVAPGHHKDWLISPKFTVKAGTIVNMDMRSTGAKENFEIWVCKGDQNITDPKYKLELNMGVANTWTLYQTSPLWYGCGVSVGDEVSIAIKAISQNKGTLLLDNFKVTCTSENPTPKFDINTWAGNGEINTEINGNVVKLYNIGIAPLTITSITDLSADVFSSSLTTGNMADVNLGYGEFKEISFTANSANAGDFTKTFTITTNGGDISVDLSATISAVSTALSQFSTGFDTGIPAEMKVIDGNADGSTWVASDKKPRNGSAKGAYSLRTNTSNCDDYLISPKILVKAETRLVFYATTEKTWSSATETFDILVSKTDNLAPSKFNIEIATDQTVVGVNYIRQEFIITNNADVNAGDEIYIAIKQKSPKNSGRAMYIEDYSVVSEDEDGKAYITEATIPGEVEKYILDADAKTINALVSRDTDLSSIDVTFEISSGASISPSGAQNFSAGAVTYTVTAQDGITTNNYVVSLTAEAAAITSFYETFETDALPVNWKTINNNNDGKYWAITSVTSSNHTETKGSKAAYIGFGSSITHDDFLIAPYMEVKEGSKVSFFTKADNNQGEKFQILASKTGAHAEDFTIVIDADAKSKKTWEEKTYTLTDHADINAGDKIYFAIKAMATDPTKFVIDDFKVEVAGATPSIVSMTFTGIKGNAVIDNEAHTVTADALYATDLTAIEPTFVLSADATYTPEGVQNFSAGAITYTLTANSIDQAYEVTITKEQNPAAEILSVIVEGQLNDAIINSTDKTVNINVSSGTNLSALAPTIVVSPAASINPDSEITQDFSAGAVEYTVTAENLTEAIWTINIQKEVALEGLFEGFEGGEELPIGWLTVDKDGNNKDWNVKENAAFEGNYGIGTKRNMSGNNDWLITPKVKVRAGDQLTFMARSTAIDYLEDFNVKVSKAGTDVDTDFTISIAEIIKAPGGTAFFPYEYILSDVDGIEVGDEIYIAFQCVSFDKSELHLDNISVAPAPSTAEIEINKTSFLQIAKVGESNNSGEIFTIKNVLASTLTISEITGLDGTAFSTNFDIAAVNLAPDETYSFSVTFNPTVVGDQAADMLIKSNGGDVTLSLGGYAYAEGCYYEPFEEEASYKYWETLDNDGDGEFFFPFANNEQAPDVSNTGNVCMLSASAFYPNTILTPDNFLITPKLSVKDGDKVVFWAGVVMEGSFVETVSVLVSTKKKAIADFANVVLDNEVVYPGWKKYEFDLSEYKGEEIFLAFRHHNSTDNSQLKIDDVILPGKYIPTKPDLIVKYQKPEYPIIPKSQEFITKFKAKVTNLGAELTTATNLNIVVEGSDFNESHILNTPMAFEGEQEFVSNDIFSTPSIGDYKLKISVDNTEDEDISNNSISFDIKVDEHILARETGNVTRVYSFGSGLAGNVGQKFEITKKDRLTAVRVLLYEPEAGTKLQFELRTMGDQPGYTQYLYPVNVVAQTPIVSVPSKQTGWYTANFETPVDLEPGLYFISSVEQKDQVVPIAYVEDFYTPESIYFQSGSDENWHLLDVFDPSAKTFTIRAILDGAIGIEEVQESEIEFSMLPNPASNNLKITTDEEAQMFIIDELGRTVLTQDILSGTTQINVESLNQGSYIVRLIENGKQSVKKLVIRH